MGKCHFAQVGKIWYSHKYNFGIFIKTHMFDGYASCSRVYTKCQVSLIIFDLQTTNNKRLRTAGLHVDHFIYLSFLLLAHKTTLFIFIKLDKLAKLVLNFITIIKLMPCVYTLKLRKFGICLSEFARIVKKIWQTPSELSLLSFWSFSVDVDVDGGCL